MNKRDINRQFDRLLGAMAPPVRPVSARRKPSSDQPLDAGHDAYCSDTQTHPDTSKDASR